MGKKKRAKVAVEPTEEFSYSVGDPAFAGWWFGTDGVLGDEHVSPWTVMGLSAIARGVQVIAGTIAGLPLRTYEGEQDDRQRVDSVFDDPYPGIDGMTPFEWIETVVAHQVLWRNAYLWHEDRSLRTGDISAFVPLVPDAIEKVERRNGRKVFTFTDPDTKEKREVGSEVITHLPALSLSGIAGFDLIRAARAIFAGAMSGDKAAQNTLRRGIRLGGLLVPAEGEEVEPTEAQSILDDLRAQIVGVEHAGDVALINKRMELRNWSMSNIDSQWNETRQFWLGEAGRILGVPNILMNDTEKQTSWGTGVAEQTLNFARFTLMHYTSRLEQRLSLRLPKGQFVEFDYTGLLQGTPSEEIELLLKETGKPFLLVDEARKIRNLPPLTPAEESEINPAPSPAPTPLPVRKEATA